MLTSAIVSFNTKVLRGLSVSNRAEKSRSFLATSPVKYLSSFLSGNTASDTISSPKHQHQRSLTGEAPILLPNQLNRSNSSRDANSLYGSAKSREDIRMNTTGDGNRPENPLARLEQTFTGYMASLQARKGSIIGRTLLNRSNVDELSVNDLYNKLIGSPFDIDESSDLTPDVVFVAFEKFVRIAWREHMGPIITPKALDALQERASKRFPGEFADFVRFLFADMAPQNRRAFTSLIKLLADLLDGCGNDSDRGALTLAFAELLVDDDTAHNYINLLDKLVEDCDRIFDDRSNDFGASMGHLGPAFESVNSTTRSTKSHTGSLTSNTSSLRRKLGFDNFLTRQNSKTDADNRPSMWRSLSKHSRHPATGESPMLVRSPVVRTRSVDVGVPSGPNKLRRPGSRDRPPIAGAFDDAYSRPNSSQKLETIGEPETEEIMSKGPKKKRRSSLSDLKSLMAAASLEDEPLQPLSHMKQTSEKFNSGPRIPAPSRIPTSPNSQNLANNLTFRSSRQKENVDDPFQPTASSSESPKKTHTKMLSTSNIPTLRTPRENGTAAVDPRPTSSPTKSPGKLRLQSTQKLRERLQTEKKAIEDVDANLQTELSKISADMAKVNSSLPRSATADIRKLSSSVKALEDRIPALVAQLTDQHDQLRRDMESTIKTTDAKVKAIDQLYKETTAENEILYEKFNSELGKIVKALKGKGRDDKEELMTRMRDCSEETARTKKENARLRREMASLRTLLKGNNAGGDA